MIVNQFNFFYFVVEVLVVFYSPIVKIEKKSEFRWLVLDRITNEDICH